MVIQDQNGRIMRKLRVSLTEACNHACFYCMPDTMVVTPKSRLLSPKEIQHMVSTLVLLGVEQVRVTGGEPSMRPEFLKIMQMLGEIDGLSLNMTTNGQMLEKDLPFLKDNHLQNINFSLDSLDPGRFHKITKGGDFTKVMRSILKAKELGIDVKINTVIMRGINDRELGDFLEWGERNKIEVRFLELMRIGTMAKSNEKYFMSAKEIRTALQSQSLTPREAPHDSTSQRFTNLHGAKLGIIASESEPFCSTCSRIRLSATGTLRACLFKEDGINLKGRRVDEYPKILKELLTYKPMTRMESIDQAMHQIGG